MATMSLSSDANLDKGRSSVEKALVASVLADHAVRFQRYCEALREKGEMPPPADIVLTPGKPFFLVETKDPQHVMFKITNDDRLRKDESP